MKKGFILLLTACLLLSQPVWALEDTAEAGLSLPCEGAVLIERSTKTVLYAKNADKELSPASVTKVMTMLLVCEAIENGSISLDDMVTASARAASMGGSQIWLEEGERMSVAELLKCVAVVSANDCAVALAELLCGSEEAFAARMNRRAGELGLEHTHFANCTGLSSAKPHYTSAYDMAVISAELLRHECIRPYTCLWTDTIRDGKFALTNTNKLVRFYDGCTGLKTGFTNEAMFCLSASAERDGTEYVAVILHGQSSAERFDAARTLLDYAFANFAVAELLPTEPLPALRVEKGKAESVPLAVSGETRRVLEKADLGAFRWETELPENLAAPVEAGERVGTLQVYMEDALLAELPLLAAESVARRTAGDALRELMQTLFG